jgi:hypothetical protein
MDATWSPKYLANSILERSQWPCVKELAVMVEVDDAAHNEHYGVAKENAQDVHDKSLQQVTRTI